MSDITTTAGLVKRNAQVYVPYQARMQPYERSAARYFFAGDCDLADPVMDPAYVREREAPDRKWLPVFSSSLGVDRWHEGVPRVKVGMRDLAGRLRGLTGCEGIVVDATRASLRISREDLLALADGGISEADAALAPVELDLTPPPPAPCLPVEEPAGSVEFSRRLAASVQERDEQAMWSTLDSYVRHDGCVLVGYLCLVEARDKSGWARDWFKGIDVTRDLTCEICAEFLRSSNPKAPAAMVAFTDAEKAIASRKQINNDLVAVPLAGIARFLVTGRDPNGVRDLLLDPRPMGVGIHLKSDDLATLCRLAEKS